MFPGMKLDEETRDSLINSFGPSSRVKNTRRQSHSFSKLCEVLEVCFSLYFEYAVRQNKVINKKENIKKKKQQQQFILRSHLFVHTAVKRKCWRWELNLNRNIFVPGVNFKEFWCHLCWRDDRRDHLPCLPTCHCLWSTGMCATSFCLLCIVLSF